MNTLSKLYSPLIGREIDPMLEITVSVGAFGILFSAIQGLVNPGEEVGMGSCIQVMPCLLVDFYQAA